MRIKRTPHAHTVLLVILLLVVVANCYLFMRLVYVQEPAGTNGQGTWSPEMLPTYTPVSPPALEGFVPIEVNVIPGVIYLTSNCSEMTMVTTESQTYSIDNGIRGVIDPRPTPHDVLKEALMNWDINVTMAKIEKMSGGAYYATLVMEQGNKTLMLDCRPSDSIATAIRFGAPIYISEQLLKEQGHDIC